MVFYMIALDQSRYSKQTFRSALSQIKSTDVLFIVTVIESPWTKQIQSFIQIRFDQYRSLQEELKQEGKKFLYQYFQRAKLAGLEDIYLILLVSSHPGEAIVRCSQRKQVDFLYVGTLGNTDHSRSIKLGSVASYILHHSKCNVVLVKSVVNYRDSLSDHDSPRVEKSENDRWHRIYNDTDQIQAEIETSKIGGVLPSKEEEEIEKIEEILEKSSKNAFIWNEWIYSNQNRPNLTSFPNSIGIQPSGLDYF